MVPRLQRRLLHAAILLGVLALLGIAVASTRADRIAYAALPAGVALVLRGAAWWLHGGEVSTRPYYDFRGVRLTGWRVASVGYALKAGGVAFVLMGLWCVALWLAPGLAGL